MPDRFVNVIATLSCAGILAACSANSSPSRGSFESPTDPTAGSDGTGTDGSGAPGPTSPDTPAPQPDKVGCAGTKYTEALPTSASLSSLSYSSSSAQTYMLSALGLRYPIGKFILQGGLSSPLSAQQGSCFDRFIRDKSTASAVLNQAETVVHECGHFFDLGQSSGAGSTYVITPALKLSCDGGDTTKRGGSTFARSRLRGDTFNAKRAPCNNQPKMGCDSYADTYLDGSDTDSTFQSGDQGFNSVLEEATQYVNSLASSLAFQETFQGSKSSQRDGILTFLWYIERYLQMARTTYPAAYTTLSGDPCWRQAILSIWDRGWFFLGATSSIDSLGLDDAAIEPLVKDASLVAEIDALRKLECQ